MLRIFIFVILIFCGSVDAAVDLADGWNPETGLWTRSGPGHTFAVENREQVHEGRGSANRLLNAALLGRLDEVNALAVLEGLRSLQDTDPASDTFGCMRWYAEEVHVDDTNAAFFVGLPLLLLHYTVEDRLSAAERSVMEEIFSDLKIWFLQAVERHPRVYYPNKYLGDLVCAWLLLEVTGDDANREALGEAMLTAADYWTEHGWGWGEHMSDGYVRVCMEEISILLCFANELPQPINAAYETLLNTLLRIEDLYGGDPRVPAVRSYAFTRSPQHQNFRDKVRQWRPEELLERYSAFNPGHLLNARAWHQRVAPRADPGDFLQIPCFGGATATAWLQPDFRLGSLSRFPLMPTAEHSGWGLAWQSFPVAMWRPEGDWGFHQWLVREAGETKAHPAVEWNSAYLNNALSRTVSPPIVGRTFTLQKGGDLLVLRILPATDINWESATDQFRIVNNHAEVEVLPADGPWSQVILRYDQREVSLNHVNLMNSPSPIVVENAHKGSDWAVTWENDDLRASPANELGKVMLVSLWGISASGVITERPVLRPLETVPMQRTPEQCAHQLQWTWPNRVWTVAIDPMAEIPLIELSPVSSGEQYPFVHLKALPAMKAPSLAGNHIRRTMNLLSTSTEVRPNKVKILFFGQSITRQDYSRKIIESQLRSQFPSAHLEVMNPAIGGYEAPRSLQTLHHTLIPHQPDLVVFHVYGGEDDGTYEEILRQIRSATSADIMCVTHHLDNYGPERTARMDAASDLRRELAQQYGTELVDVRADWRRYLGFHGLPAADLLVDKIHHNAHGGELWGALQARHFQVQSSDGKAASNAVSHLDFRAGTPSGLQLDSADWEWTATGLRGGKVGARLTIPVNGTRLDVVAGEGEALLDVSIDGKRPSEFLGTWAATLPSSTPIDYRPAIMRVLLSGQPVAEKWTVTVDSCSEDGKAFRYSVRGSISGEQGEGDHTGPFLSRNGIIELRPELFALDHAIEIKKQPIPTPFDITWEVYPMVPDQIKVGRSATNTSGQSTLFQCLPNAAYTVDLLTIEGSVQIEELLIYRPH